METKKISLKTLAVSIAVTLLIETAFRLSLRGNPGSPLPALGIVRCLESILLAAIVRWLEDSTAAIGLDRPKILSGFRRGLVWSAGFGVAAAVLFLVLMAIGVNALKFLHSAHPSSWPQIVLFFLVGGLLAPIAEEFFFRGVIYGFLRQWGTAIAIVFSTLVFVLAHPTGSSIPVTQIVGGIIFAVAYEKERNLMVPITIHCLGNLAIFSLTIFI